MNAQHKIRQGKSTLFEEWRVLEEEEVLRDHNAIELCVRLFQTGRSPSSRMSLVLLRREEAGEAIKRWLQ